MRSAIAACAVSVLACAAASRADGAGAGDEVIVIYNSRIPESKAVAEYYAERRKVPASQVFGFDLEKGSDFTRADFRRSLQRPLARALEQKKLWRITSTIVPASSNSPARVEWKVRESKIRYAVICYGVPYRIAPDPGLNEPVAETMRGELRRNEAAVDSELATLPGIEQKLPVTGVWNNPAYAVTNDFLVHPTNGVLIVARLDGPSAAIARGLVDKAIEAETNGLWGRAYFDKRDIADPAYKPGDDAIGAAAEISRHYGFETVVDENPATFPPEFPMSHIGLYCGWYDETASGPFTRPTVEFMPGAFAYHLHSYSAADLRNPAANWVGPLLAKGATITMGCVAEPYLAGTPNIGVFLGRFVYLGFSFGEAAYAAQGVLSWQTTVVGDPLFRPFAKPLTQLHEELTRRKSPLIEWANLRTVNLYLASGRPSIDLSRFLTDTPVTRESAVLTEKLGDLYFGQGKPSSAVEMYERALTLKPSPQQRIRLRLTLAEKLSGLGRDAEAAETLAKILEENPDYPAPINIYRRLATLARKLGKDEAAAGYEQRIKELSPPPAPKPAPK